MPESYCLKKEQTERVPTRLKHTTHTGQCYVMTLQYSSSYLRDGEKRNEPISR